MTVAQVQCIDVYLHSQAGVAILDSNIRGTMCDGYRIPPAMDWVSCDMLWLPRLILSSDAPLEMWCDVLPALTNETTSGLILECDGIVTDTVMSSHL